VDERHFKVINCVTGEVDSTWTNFLDALQVCGNKYISHKDQPHHRIEHRGRIVHHTDPYAKTMWHEDTGSN
jgi:hypothetical protein